MGSEDKSEDKIAEVRRAGEGISALLEQIEAFFKPGVLLTLVVRRPDDATGSQDFVMSNDDYDEVKRVLDRRVADPAGITIPADV